MTDLTWDAPGPGGWFWDGAHASKPTSRLVQDVLPKAMRDGFQRFTPDYGLPISHIEVRYVNDYAYSSVQLANLGEREIPPPVAAEQALATKRWRGELQWWEDVERPALVDARRRLQSVDLASLSDDELANHLEEGAREFARGMTTHFALVGATAIPVGDFLAHSHAWGLPHDDCLALLVGEHPLTRARRECASIDELSTYIGCWLLGRYDVTGRTLSEEPNAIDAAWRATPPSAPSPGMLREKVPADDRDLFDELLAEARHCFSARDDHATIGGLWSMGIIRRALLEAGRRLSVGDGVFHLSCDETAAALRGDRTGLVDLIDERAAHNEVVSRATPPPMLGEGGGPPAFELPGPLGRMLNAMFAYLEGMNGSAAALGIGGGKARGRAVVAFDPEDAIDRIEPGDILVTTTTTPAFGAVLPMLGGLVTTTGGTLSHAAIVARELGIPAVVGAADALARIADGTTIEIDAATAEVRIVS